MAESSFAPVAIVGRACLLPGARNPAELASLVLEGRDAITPAIEGRWGMPKSRVMGSTTDASGDRSWSDRGGYVVAWEDVIDPKGFGALSERSVRALDPLFQWVLHVSREAMRDCKGIDPSRTGAILGNLSFPTEAMSRFAANVWLGAGDRPDARNRFMSGLPAHLLGPALGLSGPRFCLDAACASSLYAIAHACDALASGQADWMLAGAVSRADDLFIHVGFCALAAMSKSGRSRPFHADADGLVPAEGCAVLVLRRLSDAVRDGDRILGVIRGVGLSNDGRGRGLLAPSEDGQVRAMQQAYARAGISPSTVSYVECHATGTPVGDATELASLARVMDAGRVLPIGSFKANVGHLVTAAGAAGVLKILAAIEARSLPPTPHVDVATKALDASRFRVLGRREAWNGMRRAAISAFGFGGNNAHVVIDEWMPEQAASEKAVTAVGIEVRATPRIAIVGIGARVADGQSVADLASAWREKHSRVRPRPEGGVASAHADEVVLELNGLRFPPTDLERTIAQQTMLLAAAREVASTITLPPLRTGVFSGMGCDSEVARWGARWRLGETDAARDAIAPKLVAATVVGTMPNVPANRVSSQLDLGGPSHTVSAEERSGLVALSLARRALEEGELDAALVCASEVCSEPVHEAAMAELRREAVSGDAAVALVLEREDDAKKNGHAIFAILGADLPAEGDAKLVWRSERSEIERLFGRPHAAVGLLHVAVAAIELAHGDAQHPAITIETPSLEGPTERVTIERAGDRRPWPTARSASAPVIRFAAHPPRPQKKNETMTKPSSNGNGHGARSMPRAPALPPVGTVVSVAAPRAHATLVAVEPEPVVIAMPVDDSPLASILSQAAEHQRVLGELHKRFVEEQVAMHQRFLAMREQMNDVLIAGVAMETNEEIVEETHSHSQSHSQLHSISQAHSISHSPAPSISPSPAPVPTPRSLPTKKKGGLSPSTTVPTPKGPTFDRKQLEIHASGKISEIFGPLFAQQDAHAVQVRMPTPPMLLATRCTGIDATPGVLGKGTCWTETDVTETSWYLHQGRMPPGVWIESGQADLFLISYMGIDFLNQGKRCYRLLGCELTYHRSPPRVGETLTYDIHVDGHANQGDVRLMFFHYDCRIGGQPALTVRNGQAGFFTTQELDESAGILWKAETQEIDAQARVDAPRVPLTKTSLSRDDLEALARGRTDLCFGAGFEAAASHVRSPRIQDGRMLFLDRVDAIDPKGGPWKRGYLKATQTIHPDHWFFDGHFHLDPCMPGTLMFDGCMQTMSVYLAAMGVTLARDGWRFEPVTGETYKMLCRGQVTPKSKQLVYEVFVEELRDDPSGPVLYADLLCTVDGLGAFHARRMGLRLVPDWPMEERGRLIAADAPVVSPGDEPTSLTQTRPDRPVAVAESGASKGFPFDYASLVACAWGKPSTAFGPIYERFDSHRKVARLPGPPYHFMSRIARVSGEMGVAKAGAEVEVEYDVPQGAWYFAENGHAVMPYAVLMEAALQPCGWLASYVGCALLKDEDLLFRNLDGKATVHAEVGPDSGVLKTVSKLKSVSLAGSMIIVGFDVKCTLPERGDELVYSLDTVFGFFPLSAFENQAGLPINDAQKALFAAPKKNEIDLVSRPAKLCDGTARLATRFLLMLDRLVHLDLDGGAAKLGAARAEKTVDRDEWFFKAHFFQDPVQPGSLGVEAMCQLLQLVMLEKSLAEGMERPRFEAVARGTKHVWKYRGQVVPANQVIGCSLEITKVEREANGVVAFADASLWVDGKRIYDAQGLAMRIVGGDGTALDDRASPRRDGRGEAHSHSHSHSHSPSPSISPSISHSPSHSPAELTLDLSRDGWLADHSPTWVIPALPAMSMLDRVHDAAHSHTGKPVAAVEHIQIVRWITLDPSARIRTRVEAIDGDAWRVKVTLEAFRTAKDARLSRFEPAAEAVVVLGDVGASPAAPQPLTNPRDGGDPYAEGRLFHGPRFQRLRSLRVGDTGSTAILDASRGDLSADITRQIVLDACTHGIPHDGLHAWSSTLASDRAAYPFRIEHARFFGPTPTAFVRVEARLAEASFDRARITLTAHDESTQKPWLALELVEVLLPKGPIGLAAPKDREAFLRDRSFVAGVGLSRTTANESSLALADLVASNWLPGTIQKVYGATDVTDPSELAFRALVKDHVGQATATHPSAVEVNGTLAAWKARSTHEPLSLFAGTTSATAEGLTVRAASALDLSPVRDFWRSYLKTGPWPGEDLYFSLIERFVRRVRVEDPAALAKVRGKSVLFLGNHQVGIESLLFGIVASALTGTSTLTLAKKEHRETWLGKLILHGFGFPGLRDPRVIAYFDREDPASLPAILQDLAAMMRAEGKNVMIHVEGTRSLSCSKPISKMSGVFVDMALTLGVPIVPVRFVGGLPRTELTERLEYPLAMGKQDHFIGAPILPETIAKLPYKERTDHVLARINALGPGHEHEQPIAGDEDLAGKVAMRVAESDALPAFATVRAVLEARGASDPRMQQLVEAARHGAPLTLDASAESAWLATIAEWLFGPRGPAIQR
jgi:3-oxoacyl-(acyl-carrier-protein) synthase/3-hydroxymyristoyl/3-hydroxydecanoyl-(acyl carrier protein) dehydratase/1-acyl-sn-glycerol-3-phosphate acyltransferase